MYAFALHFLYCDITRTTTPYWYMRKHMYFPSGDISACTVYHKTPVFYDKIYLSGIEENYVYRVGFFFAFFKKFLWLGRFESLYYNEHSMVFFSARKTHLFLNIWNDHTQIIFAPSVAHRRRDEIRLNKSISVKAIYLNHDKK